MKKYWIILSLIALITGCRATSEIINPEEYDATKHARVRVFASGEQGAMIYLNVGVDCETNKEGTFIRPDGWFNSVNRIGMTQTAATDKAQMKGIKFREFVIPAGKVVNITPADFTAVRYCGKVGQPCNIHQKQICEYGPRKKQENILLRGLVATLDTIEKITTLGNAKDESDESKRSDDRRSFIPQAGHQYEFNPVGCGIIVKDITEEEITEVKLSPYYQCPSEK